LLNAFKIVGYSTLCQKSNDAEKGGLKNAEMPYKIFPSLLALGIFVFFPFSTGSGE
jgi:hypothetical protein